jgi:hypothetical protein
MNAPLIDEVERRQVRGAATGFLVLGIGALLYDFLSPNPEQLRYAQGAAFLIVLSAITFFQARD